MRPRVGRRDRSLRSGPDRWALLARLRLDIQARLHSPPGDPDPIPLQLRGRADLITQPYVGVTLAPAAENPISVAFAAADQALLIVGRPGAGKSRLLAELAAALLAKAEAKTHARIPVLVHLASWSSDLTLAEWLSAAIHVRYQTGMERARAWIEADLLLPLLDGLDETSDPAACATAINAYRGEHPRAGLAVATRLANYVGHRTWLDLGGAVEVLPLTGRRIDAYLRQAGIEPDEARVVLGDALLGDPLILTMAARALLQQPDALQLHGSFDRRRAHLVSMYPAIMLARQPRYRPAAAMRWLHHLACWMQDYPEVNPEFRLEWLQPNWLPASKLRVFHRLALAAVGMVGAVFGGLAGASYAGMANVVLPRIPELKPLAELLVGPGVVLLGAALGALINSVALGVEMWRGGLGKAINASEEPWWSWPAVLSEMRSWLYAGLLIGVVAAVIITHSDQWDAWIAAAPEATALLLLLGAPLAGVLGGLSAALLTGVFQGLSFLRRTVSSTPNEGIRWAGWSALFFWVTAEVAGLITYALVIVLYPDLPAGIRIVLLVGLHTGLLVEWAILGAIYIGSAYIQHYLLRALLVRCGYMPWRYVRFLDHATKRHLLRRVGGAYEFIHTLLRQHFVDLRFDEPL